MDFMREEKPAVPSWDVLWKEAMGTEALGEEAD